MAAFVAHQWPHLLAVAGWTWALINWIRLRQTKKIQEELVRRLTARADKLSRPSAGTHTRVGSAGALLFAILFVLLLAHNRGHDAQPYADGALVVVGWSFTLWFWQRLRTLRKTIS